MAGVESAAAPPQAPPAPAPPRAVAPAPAKPLRLADFVVVVVCFGFLVFAWGSSAANAAFIAAELGYGWASIQAAATKELAVAAAVVLGLFIQAIILILVSLSWREASRRDGEVGAGGGTAVQPGRADEPVHGAVLAYLLALFMVIAVAVLIQVGSWAMGDRDQKAGHLLLETVFFLGSVIFCFVTFPLLIIRLVITCRAETREATMPN